MLFVNSYRPATQTIQRPETNATIAAAKPSVFRPAAETNASIATGSSSCGSSCGSSSGSFSAVA